MTRAELEHNLCERIIAELKTAIDKKGEASLLVSGGSTPKNLFYKLSQSVLPWEKVKIGLVDDRFLPESHTDSNAKLVKQNLLVNEAARATFIPLVLDSSNFEENVTLAADKVEEIKRPFTVVILGMGGDSHTASLFPKAEALAKGMDKTNKDDLIGVIPPEAPYRRVSFTRSALLNTENLFLHIYGADKKEVFETSKASGDELKHPIAGFINQPEKELELFWAE